MQLTVTVCNVCQDMDRDTEWYEVKRAGSRVRVDLCKEHAAPLEALFDKAEKRLATKRSSMRRKPAASGRRSRVVSLEEIEKQKKKAQ